jgi:hypothetical protein
MNVTAAEIRPYLRDADLLDLATTGGTFETWERMVEALAGEWHEDWAERLTFAAPEIAKRANWLWPAVVKSVFDRERRDRAFVARRDLHSRDWRSASEATSELVPWRDSRALGSEVAEKLKVSEQIPAALVLDGSLVAQTLAIAIHETLAETEDISAYSRLRAAGADRETAVALATLATVLTPNLNEEVVELGVVAAQFLKLIHSGNPELEAECDILTTTVAVVRGHGHLRADLLEVTPREAERAGRAVAGDSPVAGAVSHQSQSGEKHVLALDGLVAVHLPDEIFARIKNLTPAAAQRRLEELAVEFADDEDLFEALRSLAEALAPAKDAQHSLADFLGSPAEAIVTGQLVHGSRVYEAAPRNHAAPLVSGKAERQVRVRALSDSEGRHVGFAAFDPLSREFRGRALWAVYDLAGKLVGRLEEDEGGLRFRSGLPTGGFVSVPITIITNQLTSPNKKSLPDESERG